MARAVYAGTCPDHPDTLCIESDSGAHECLSHATIAGYTDAQASDWLNATALAEGSVEILQTTPDLIYRVMLT